MACPKCGGKLVLRGSMARGRYVCASCEPEVFTGSNKIMERYTQEVYAWHRSWCASIQARVRGRSDPSLCNCGHSQPSPLSQEQIEQLERSTYGG